MNYNLVDPTTGQVVGTVTMGAVAAAPAPGAPQPASPGTLGVNLEYKAKSPRFFSIYHPGGKLEIKCDAVPGKGTFNSLTESLVGPRGFPERTSTPAGSLKTHQAFLDENAPAGTYTYTVAPDVDSWMVVLSI